MFARRMIMQLPRGLKLTTIPRPRTLTISGVRYRSAEKIAEIEVPVVSYVEEDSTEAKHTTLTVDQSRSNITVPAGDVAKQAFAVDQRVLAKLSPTLKKFTLIGKVALVTGGARGLGWNMAQALAEVGVKAIVILDVQEELGDQAAAEMHGSTGIPTVFYKVDIRDGNAIAVVVSKVVEQFGSIDVVINSAGIADSNIKATTYDPAMFRRLIDINLTGAFLIAQACARQMIAQKTGGSIILIASMSGSIVNYPQEQSCYNASKAAVIQLGKSLAAEWAQHGIRVNTISPGYMDTALNRVPALEAQKKIWMSMTPMQRLGKVDELNGLAVFLASEASSLVTGADYIADGGYTVY